MTMVMPQSFQTKRISSCICTRVPGSSAPNGSSSSSTLGFLAIAKKPKVLLLDEPFGALDPGTRVQMHELIRFVWKDCGMTIVMVTHDIKEAFALGTRMIALDKRRRDPQAPGRFGAVITYDLDLTRDSAVPVLGFLKTFKTDEQPAELQGA